jgi:hypothetical protein
MLSLPLNRNLVKGLRQSMMAVSKEKIMGNKAMVKSKSEALRVDSNEHDSNGEIRSLMDDILALDRQDWPKALLD